MHVREIGNKERESDKKCNAIMIDQAELDTVPICRDRRMTMEAIMTRDQRTTSHRVLERGGQSNMNVTSSYQKIMKTSNDKTCVKKSSMSIGKNEATRTAMTCQTNVHEVVDSTKTRKHKTENEEESLRCDETCHCRCNFENDTRQIDRDLTNECCERNNFISGDRSFSHVRHRTNVITWLRLGSLLVTLLMVTVQGAPTAMTLEDRRLSSPPKWVNPCGLAAEDFDGDLDVVQLKDEQLLGQVVVQAKTALDHAQLFRDDYIKRTFNTDFTDLHTTWKGNHYDWLPGLKEIPKQLGEHLDQEYLDKLEVRLLDNALLDAYEYMQRYAVGLEQIVWDQEDHRLEFRKQFKETEFKLRTVLCELQVALVERGVAPRPDVTRDAMSGEYRAMSASATFRNLRDWLIFRDYMNGLEYVVQVFEHLRRGLES